MSKSDDLISRQAAIDIERRATVDTNPKHFKSHQKFVEFMDDAEISSFGRWQWSNGFNTALTAVGIDLKRLPSAEPKIGRDCTDFVRWLMDEVMDEENWQMNAVANGEIICRKLKKLGMLDVVDGYYIKTQETGDMKGW